MVRKLAAWYLAVHAMASGDPDHAHARLCALGETERMLRKVTPDVVGGLVDVRDPEEIEDFVELAAERYGRIDCLINNAAVMPVVAAEEITPAVVDQILQVNLRAPILFTKAAIPHLRNAGGGSVIHMASVTGHLGHPGITVYGATKAFILFLSQSLHAELSPKGVYIQAVLPAATRTEIWGHAGKDVDTLPAVMEVDELVDAALAGFDRRETVTIPPLPDGGQWNAFEAARKVMLPNFSQVHAAERHRNGA